MNKQKILVSDYDGTFFLDENGIVENINKVKEFRIEKNLFAIATGNNLNNFKRVISKYNIEYDYLILDQGACVFDKTNKLLKANFLDYKICKNIVDRIEQIDKQYKLCNAHEETKIIDENTITKIVVDFTDLEKAFEFTNKIKEEFGEYVNAYTMIFKKKHIVEIISSKTDKNEAIKYIINKEKISKDYVYTIGDGYNDISMIQNFNGYCMENSVNELLEKCNNRVKTVADLIQKLKEF